MISKLKLALIKRNDERDLEFDWALLREINLTNAGIESDSNPQAADFPCATLITAPTERPLETMRKTISLINVIKSNTTSSKTQKGPLKG